MNKNIISIGYGLLYVWIGIMHFVSPTIFEPIVPTMIAFPTFWVYLSGVAEVLLGLGVCIPKFRARAAQFLMLMLCVLYTANVNMWYNDIPFQGHILSTGEHLFRGVMQIVLFIVAYWVGKPSE